MHFSTQVYSYAKRKSNDSFFKKKFIYTSDPKALYHLLVKDQDVFEETDEFVE